MKEYKLTINGNEYAVAINNVDGDMAQVTVNGTEYCVGVEGVKAIKAPKTPKIIQAAAIQSGDDHRAVQKTSSPAATASAVGGGIKSPLPGVILDVMVREGDIVKVGHKLMLLEAMKMENNIEADRDGKVISIAARKGDSVLEGDILITIG